MVDAADWDTAAIFVGNAGELGNGRGWLAWDRVADKKPGQQNLRTGEALSCSVPELHTAEPCKPTSAEIIERKLPRVDSDRVVDFSLSSSGRSPDRNVCDTCTSRGTAMT